MRKNARMITLLLMLLIFVAGPTAAQEDAATRSPQQLYSDAIAKMDVQPRIPSLTFVTSLQAQGVRVSITRDSGGEAAVSMGLGSGQPLQRWNTSYDSNKHVSQLTMPDGSAAASHMPLFDPTWRGAHEWISYGIDGPPARGVDAAPAAVQPAASGPVIAQVTALAPSRYVVTSAGTTQCPDGTAGIALKMVPKEDPAHYPLRLAIVNNSGMFCALRFDLRGSGGIMGVTGSVQLNFSPVDRFLMVSGGKVDMEARFFGIGLKHASITFQRTDYRFSS